jgi:hypothetical protein
MPLPLWPTLFSHATLTIVLESRHTQEQSATKWLFRKERVPSGVIYDDLTSEVTSLTRL